MKIKITHPAAIKMTALLTAWVIKLWMRTLRYRFVVDDPQSNPRTAPRRGLYLFWHETLLMPAYTHARGGFSILVSTHRDGELIAQTVGMLGGGSIRGSSTRGGAKAVINMLRDRKARHLAITPDGPRGPRREMQMGAIYLASRGGMPLIPIGYAAGACWRAPSWDRMVLPKPGARAVAVAAAPIDVPGDLSREQLETYRRRVQQAMDDAQARAERIAAGEPYDGPLLKLNDVRGRE